MSWQPCVLNSDYEICDEYPYQIRRIGTDTIISEFFNNYGYPCLHMNGDMYLKHRLVAEQFIPNPNNLPYIDHINRDRSDYHITNLRWVSNSENQRNRISHRGIEHQFFDEISEDAIEVYEYGEHSFEDLYFHDDNFYVWTGLQYRQLHINVQRHRAPFVCATNTDGKVIHISIPKFKRMYDLA